MEGSCPSGCSAPSSGGDPSKAGGALSTRSSSPASVPAAGEGGEGLSSPKVSLYLVHSTLSSFLSFRAFVILIPLSPMRPGPCRPLLNCVSGARAVIRDPAGWVDGGAPSLAPRLPGSYNHTHAGGQETEAHDVKTLPRAQGHA